MKPMRPWTATLAGAVVAVAITGTFAALRGELRWFDLIATAAAFHGFRWFFLNGWHIARLHGPRHRTEPGPAGREARSSTRPEAVAVPVVDDLSALRCKQRPLSLVAEVPGW